MIDRTLIEPLHRAYCNLTGFEIVLSMDKVFIWERFLSHGWGCTELSSVIRHIQAGIRKNTRRVASLRFDNLIEKVDRFEYDLAEIRCASNLKEKARRPVVRETRAEAVITAGRHTEHKTSEVLQSPAFKALLEFRRNNG